MNTLTLTTIPCCPGQRRRAPPLLSAILAQIQRQRRIAPDTQRLAGLSDHQLRDIGINRSDIPLAVRFGRNRNAERPQLHWRARSRPSRHHPERTDPTTSEADL